ncbi:hypothetical protein PoB_005430200 [Plakobranchus ocellatus]|uniref:Uncharacterized protein n=1 Tax=Plakobranchus ocellatus TaxID=259542 RepID=A0AAV4C950_9GAST|nr:hypothetical protein PoB_005430200 [Plakobranchus ocellatus]
MFKDGMNVSGILLTCMSASRFFSTDAEGTRSRRALCYRRNGRLFGNHGFNHWFGYHHHGLHSHAHLLQKALFLAFLYLSLPDLVRFLCPLQFFQALLLFQNLVKHLQGVENHRLGETEMILVHHYKLVSPSIWD